MPQPSSSTLHLGAGALSCTVEPTLGACLRTLELGGVPVLRPSPDGLPTARLAGRHPLVPCANRSGGAGLQGEGRTGRLAPNNSPDPHAIHGIGWQRSWTVLRHDAA